MGIPTGMEEKDEPVEEAEQKPVIQTQSQPESAQGDSGDADVSGK